MSSYVSTCLPFLLSFACLPSFFVRGILTSSMQPLALFALTKARRVLLDKTSQIDLAISCLRKAPDKRRTNTQNTAEEEKEDEKQTFLPFHKNRQEEAPLPSLLLLHLPLPNFFLNLSLSLSLSLRSYRPRQKVSTGPSIQRGGHA